MTASSDAIPPLPSAAASQYAAGPAARRAAWRGRAAAMAALLLVVLGGALAALFVFNLVAAERERDLRQWQTRLNIVADSRVTAVGGWLERQYQALGALADNASLQIYATELWSAGRGSGGVTDAAGQADYLRNLLTAAAAQSGFTGPVLGADVRANVRRSAVAGIALLDLDGGLLAMSQAMPPLSGRLQAFITDAPRGERALLDLHIGPGGRPSIALLVPVFAIQGQADAASQVAVLLAVREADGLWQELVQPGRIEQSGESLLVRQVGARLDYLSPRLDGAAPLERSLDAATANLASAMAIGREGGFVEGRDYRGEAVLATSRRVAQTPWFVVEKVDRQEALGDSESQARRLATILLLGIALAAVAVMAAWRHGSSLRAATAAAAYRDAATRLAENRDFLRLLTDSQPNAIAIVGPDDRYSFANRRLAEEAGVEAADVVGKSVASVFGAATADPVMEGVRQARHENRVVTRLSERSGTRADGAVRTVQSQFIPLPGQSDLAGILVVDEDISQAISVQAERERQLRGLVDTLLSVVDRRDPFAQHHSARVARLAAAVSAEMGLDPATQRVAETAGGLMNLGKITVPAEILAKSEPLTNRELETVRESLQLSAELLAGIAFEGPVVETLRQVQERVDGRGQPEGRLGDQILVTARILATVNALVGLTSPRAHRAPMSIDAALDALMEETGTRFDRRVVAALISYLENHGGRAVLEADRPRRP